MAKNKGQGRGKHGNKYSGKDDGPHLYLKKHKTTERPRPCQRCRQNAYYNHDDFGYLCAAHLLDLVNIGQVLWKWEDYEEVWNRTEQLLRRPTPSTGADATKERE
jgi:hypothetical protein